MDKASFDKYKEERYIDQMKYYSAKAGKNQKKYRQFQWILIILSALTPVVAALNGIKGVTTDSTYSNSMTILVVAISSIVAILTTGMKTFNYQELWLTYRSTYEKLKPEIYYYEFNIADYGKPGIDKESLFVSRVEAILDTEHNQWPPAKKLSENQRASGNEETNQSPTASVVTNPVDNNNSVNSNITAPIVSADATPTENTDTNPIETADTATSPTPDSEQTEIADNKAKEE
ncbi:MAG: DUF4231 domain-containing protein [Chitinophagaceae bacterium]